MIERRNSPRTQHATGIIAPYIRIATHAGYCAAIAARDAEGDEWEAMATDIKEDMQECLAHLATIPEMSPFVNVPTIESLASIKADIENLLADFPDQDQALLSMQNLAHNAAWAGAIYERSTSGMDSTAGTQI